MNLRIAMHGDWVTWEDADGTERKGRFLGSRHYYTEAQVREFGTQEIVWVPEHRITAIDH